MKEKPPSRDYLVVTPRSDCATPTDAAPGDETRDARFDRLLREHGEGLVRLTSGYERDASQREDLLQEIAFAIWKALPSYRGACSERTFVYRIAHNRAITHGQRARVRRQRITFEADLADVADDAWDPAEQALRLERHQALLEAVRRLRPTLRQAVMLTLEGLDNTEAAEVLGVTPNAVAVRLTRARTEIADLLAGVDL